MRLLFMAVILAACGVDPSPTTSVAATNLCTIEDQELGACGPGPIAIKREALAAAAAIGAYAVTPQVACADGTCTALVLLTGGELHSMCVGPDWTTCGTIGALGDRIISDDVVNPPYPGPGDMRPSITGLRCYSGPDFMGCFGTWITGSSGGVETWIEVNWWWSPAGFGNEAKSCEATSTYQHCATLEQ